MMSFLNWQEQTNMKKKGLIFDMDGVIVDNAHYHILAWIKFAKNYGIDLSKEEVVSQFGSINDAILMNLFNKELDQDERVKMAFEKEEIYRALYSRDIKEVPGLTVFLEGLDRDIFSIAVATSAPSKNVEFVLGKTNLTRFFKIITDESEIKNGKPDPEIFLKTAKKMDVNPEDCIVFEDSHKGIEAANRAKMRVIGLGTSHPKDTLQNTIMNIEDFTTLNDENSINLSRIWL